MQVCVAAGDRIEEGTVLYEVDTEDMQALLARLEAQEQAWRKQEQAKRRDAAMSGLDLDAAGVSQVRARRSIPLCRKTEAIP